MDDGKLNGWALAGELSARDIELRFAELKGEVHERLDRYGGVPDGVPKHTARTTGQAVKDFVRDFGFDWVDWEDR